MALTDKLTDIANTIRSKTNTTEYMTLDEMAINIQNIKTEPKLQNKSVEILENGTTNIVADEGYDGLNNVEVTTNVEGSGKYAPMYITFRECPLIKALDEQSLDIDTSRITNMSYVFYKLNYTYTLDIRHWNTSNVTTMEYMFGVCGNLTNVYLDNLNTTNLTSMNSMFYQSTRLRNVNLRGINTSKVTSMGSMFSGCKALANVYGINESGFDTSNVTSMYGMFNNCSALTSLDLSNFNTSKVTNMGYMFYNCSALTKLDIRSFDFTKVTSYASMFSSVPAACEIIVKDDTARDWVLARRSDLTNVKTVAELEAS